MAIPIAVAAVAGFQMLTSLQQAEMIERQGKIAKEINRLNAEQARIDAFNARADGMSQVARYQSVVDNILANQEAIYAASDVDSSFGTAAQIRGASKVAAIMNTIDIENQANSKALGYERQSRSYLMQGSMAQGQAAAQAAVTRGAGLIRAATTLVSGYEKTGTPSEGNQIGSGDASSRSNFNSLFNVMEP